MTLSNIYLYSKHARHNPDRNYSALPTNVLVFSVTHFTTVQKDGQHCEVMLSNFD